MQFQARKNSSADAHIDNPNVKHLSDLRIFAEGVWFVVKSENQVRRHVPGTFESRHWRYCKVAMTEAVNRMVIMQEEFSFYFQDEMKVSWMKILMVRYLCI